MTMFMRQSAMMIWLTADVLRAAANSLEMLANELFDSTDVEASDARERAGAPYVAA